MKKKKTRRDGVTEPTNLYEIKHDGPRLHVDPHILEPI
jgi:hypothetical protein